MWISNTLGAADGRVAKLRVNTRWGHFVHTLLDYRKDWDSAAAVC